MDNILAVVSHFHPVLVHLPLGILLLAALFEWLGRLKHYAALRQSVSLILWTGTLAALFSCLTGWLLANFGEQEGLLLERHRWLGLATTGVSFLACLWKVQRGILLAITVVVLVITGYFGTALTHGEHFLIESAAILSGDKTSAEAPFFSFVPDKPVSAASTNTLEKLRKAGITVLPVAQNSHYLTVNFINVPQPTDSVWLWLVSLAPQVVSLRMNELQISTFAWPCIGKMTQVRKLYLEGTNTTNEDIIHLIALKYLEFLNLGNTKVNAQGVSQLATLPKLRQIYLFNAKISHSDYIQLQQNLPNVRIDSGKYMVPILMSDTSRLKYKK